MSILTLLIILFESIFSRSVKNKSLLVDFSLIQFNLLKLQIHLNNDISYNIRELRENKLINIFGKHIFNYKYLNIFSYKNYIGSDSFYMNIEKYYNLDNYFTFSINVKTKYIFGFGEKNHNFFMDIGKYHSWPADHVRYKLINL